MVTAHIHAELIAAFLGDDIPRYDECQCAACRGVQPKLSSSERIPSVQIGTSPLFG
jgi:hypothetical protein